MSSCFCLTRPLIPSFTPTPTPPPRSTKTTSIIDHRSTTRSLAIAAPIIAPPIVVQPAYVQPTHEQHLVAQTEQENAPKLSYNQIHAMYDKLLSPCKSVYEVPTTTKQDLFYYQQVNHPVDNPEYLKLLCDNADHLVHTFPRERIVGLGQTPAWIIDTAQLMDDKPERFSHVAFSGGTVKANFEKRPYDQYSPSQLRVYRAYLRSCQLTPDNIINDPIVLVEHTRSGLGLKSFLNILTDWADELGIGPKLRDSLHVHILVSNDKNHSQRPEVEPSSLFIKSGQTMGWDFLNSIDVVEPVRSIPKYAKKDCTGPPDLTMYNEFNHTVLEHIKAYLKEHTKLSD